MSGDTNYEKENKSLKRKIKVLEQTVSQFTTIKSSYDDLIKRLEEKDKKLLEMNEKLEYLVNERTKELEEVNKQLKYNVKLLEELSITDSLTNLRNRRSFDDIFKQELIRAKRQSYELSFILIDVDYFKQYNDFYGHDMGDRVLKTLGEVLNRFSRRANDFSFRYGGEEFAYIGTFQDEEKTLKLANNIKDAIEAENIKHEKSDYGHITVSIGALVSNSNKIETDEVFKIADENLYKLKEKGRNKVTISTIS